MIQRWFYHNCPFCMKRTESCQIYIFSALAGPYLGWTMCIYVHIYTVWRIYALYIYTDSKLRTTKGGRSNVITLLSQVKWQDHFIYFPYMFSMVLFTFVFNYCSFRKSGAFLMLLLKQYVKKSQHVPLRPQPFLIQHKRSRILKSLTNFLVILQYIYLYITNIFMCT